MLLVRNVMTEDVKTVTPDMDAYDAAGLMRSHDVGSAPVVDAEGHLVGIVTDRDLVIRVLGDRSDPSKARMGDVATRRSIFTISPDAQVSEARAMMATERVRRLPVVKGERLVGIVSLGDVAEADSSARAIGETLKEISASPATLERALRPDPGTPDRVMRHRSERRSASASLAPRSWASGPRISRRTRSRLWAINREMCICEIPIS